MNDPEIRIPVEPVPAGLLERLDARLAHVLPAQFAAVKPLPGPAARTAITAALLVGVMLALGLATGGKGWWALEGMQRAGLVAVLAVTAVWLAWHLALRMVPGSRLTVPGPVPALAAVAAASAWVLTLVEFAESSKLFDPICLAYTAISAGVAAWALRRWLRRGLVVSPSRSVGAGAAGLAAFGAIQIFCPLVDVAHILTSHLLPAIAAGAAVGIFLFGNKTYGKRP